MAAPRFRPLRSIHWIAGCRPREITNAATMISNVFCRTARMRTAMTTATITKAALDQ